jgi:hypothetical protein
MEPPAFPCGEDESRRPCRRHAFGFDRRQGADRGGQRVDRGAQIGDEIAGEPSAEQATRKAQCRLLCRLLPVPRAGRCRSAQVGGRAGKSTDVVERVDEGKVPSIGSNRAWA